MARQVGESDARPGLALCHSATTMPDGVEGLGTTAECHVDTQSREADGETIVREMELLYADWRERRTAGLLMNVVIGSGPG